MMYYTLKVPVPNGGDPLFVKYLPISESECGWFDLTADAQKAQFFTDSEITELSDWLEKEWIDRCSKDSNIFTKYGISIPYLEMIAIFV